MMNAVWLALDLSSIVAAALGGRMPEVSTASVESAKSAVTRALGLIGVMTFWLGLMRVVQAGGRVHSLARRPTCGVPGMGGSEARRCSSHPQGLSRCGR